MTRSILVILLAACGTKPLPTKNFGGTDRPVTLQVPADYDSSKRYPLVMILHGYGASGFVQEAYFGMSTLVSTSEAFVLAPDGTIDSTGEEFWNADPACCDFDNTGVDDSGYLGGLIDDVSAAWPVDPGAVLVIGHSNGGYMAYRMACDHADTVTNIIVLAGAAASDPTTCVPSQPVPVLHMHGTDDDEVPYDPNAMASVTQWAAHDNCGTTFTPGPNEDVDTQLPGDETTTQTSDGCPPNIVVELWTIVGGTHVPNLGTGFADMMFQYFLAHRR